MNFASKKAALLLVNLGRQRGAIQEFLDAMIRALVREFASKAGSFATLRMVVLFGVLALVWSARKGKVATTKMTIATGVLMNL